MRKTITAGLLITCLISPVFAEDNQASTVASVRAVSAEATTDDRKAIEKVIQDYFDGIGAADDERLQRAFHVNAAAMVGISKENGGTLRSFKDMAGVIENWAGNKNPEGAGRDGEILDMAVMDGRIAMVMFRYKDEYYDVLTLLKMDGVWKIATKT